MVADAASGFVPCGGVGVWGVGGGLQKGPLGLGPEEEGRRICLPSPLGPRGLHRASGPHLPGGHCLPLLLGKVRAQDSSRSIQGTRGRLVSEQRPAGLSTHMPPSAAQRPGQVSQWTWRAGPLVSAHQRQGGSRRAGEGPLTRSGAACRTRNTCYNGPNPAKQGKCRAL